MSYNSASVTGGITTTITRKTDVRTYTADAVSLLVYLVDALPSEVDRVFVEAEAGNAIVQAPSTALAEVLYSVSRDKDIRGITLTSTPEDARQAFIENGPVSVAPVTEAELVEYAQVVNEFSIHDALVVASHRARDTSAILTTDSVIHDAGYETIWR